MDHMAEVAKTIFNATLPQSTRNLLQGDGPEFVWDDVATPSASSVLERSCRVDSGITGMSIVNGLAILQTSTVGPNVLVVMDILSLSELFRVTSCGNIVPTTVVLLL